METIKLPNSTKIYTDLRTQSGALNRDFSLSGVSKDLTKPPIWRKINGVSVECYSWIFSYRYLDDRKKGFDIKINQLDVFEGKVNID